MVIGNNILHSTSIDVQIYIVTGPNNVISLFSILLSTRLCQKWHSEIRIEFSTLKIVYPENLVSLGHSEYQYDGFWKFGSMYTFYCNLQFAAAGEHFCMYSAKFQSNVLEKRNFQDVFFYVYIFDKNMQSNWNIHTNKKS